MDYIRKISDMYQGNILLYPPYKEKRPENIPEELYDILQVSNGIKETMIEPKTGQEIPIAWIVYPYERMMEETDFYKNEYNIEGIVFTDDGAGNPYVLKSDGEVAYYNIIDAEETKEADSLAEFYT